METDNNTAQLIKIYNEIDAFLRQQLESDRHAEHGYLLQHVAHKNRVVAKYESELRAIAQLRNSLVHNPLQEIASPIAYPHPKLLERYQSIRDALLNPKVALSIAVPTNKIYTATLETPLKNVLKKMNENTFTHVPIIKNNMMTGIFSENTLLSYLAEKGETVILDDMKIGEFKEYLPFKAHKGERFEFLSRKAELAEVYDIFYQAIKVHERIGMVFVTEHGKPTEKPLGIITAWDLASPEFVHSK